MRSTCLEILVLVRLYHDLSRVLQHERPVYALDAYGQRNRWLVIVYFQEINHNVEE